MRLARGLRERGRNGQHDRAGLGEIPIEMRKADVVANGHADKPPGRLRQHGLVARLDVIAFAVRFAVAQLHIKQMQLVVAGHDLTAVAYHERPIGDHPGVRSVLDLDR